MFVEVKQETRVRPMSFEPKRVYCLAILVTLSFVSSIVSPVIRSVSHNWFQAKIFRERDVYRLSYCGMTICVARLLLIRRIQKEKMHTIQAHVQLLSRYIFKRLINT